jgi:hypothetical protein
MSSSQTALKEIETEAGSAASDPSSASTEAKLSTADEPSAAADAPADGVPRRLRAEIKTAPIDPRDVRPSWPIAIASLERLSDWCVFALRLGTLALIQECVRELAEENARAGAIVRLRALTDALAHMPLEA